MDITGARWTTPAPKSSCAYAPSSPTATTQVRAGGGEEGVGRRAGAHVQVPGVRLRTWYWSRPSRSLPWAVFSSIFQRIPATAITSGIGVGSGA